MVGSATQFSEVNVLASQTDWAWPRAVGELFRPRGVNLIVARTPGEFVNVLTHKHVQAMIIDAGPQGIGPHGTGVQGSMATVRIVRMDFPGLPCLVLADPADQEVLTQALHLEVFSVIGKPVDLHILRRQLDRLFVRKYNSDIFSH